MIQGRRLTKKEILDQARNWPPQNALCGHPESDFILYDERRQSLYLRVKGDEGVRLSV
jgi:hypothetical protein